MADRNDTKQKQSAKMEPGMWLMIAVFAVVMVWGIASSYMKIDPDDITAQNGYRITEQTAADITLTLPMEKLRKMDLGTRVDLPEGKYAVAKQGNAMVWLEAIYEVPGYPDLLSLQFDITNNPKKNGTLLLPYTLNMEEGTYASAIGTDKTAASGGTVFPDAVSIASTGPSEKFGLYLTKEAFSLAGDTLDIVIYGMNLAAYVRE